MLPILAGLAVALVALAWVLWPVVRPGVSGPEARTQPGAASVAVAPVCPVCGPRPEADAVVCSTCGRVLR